MVIRWFFSLGTAKKQIKKTVKDIFCCRCGENLTEENCREVSTDWNISGFSHYCLSCEETYFDRLAEKQGRHLALFHCCGTFNVPMRPIATESIEDFENCEAPWISYIESLTEMGFDKRRNKPTTFFDGETDILRIFGREMTETKDFAKAIFAEKRKLEAQAGTQAQRDKWGTRIKYSSEEYDELDRDYENRAEAFKGQTITPAMEQTLISVCKTNIELEKALARGNLKAVKEAADVMDKLLASENMRKKDEKPIEHFRPDAWIVALEKMGYMEDGKFLSYDDTVKAIVSQIKTRKYPYSADVLDQFMLNIVNNARQNGDLGFAYSLPEDMKIEDEYEEFLPEETQEEIDRKHYANLTPVQFVKEGNI